MRGRGTLDPANAVEFDRVSRHFTIHHERTESFQDWFIHRFKRDRAATETFYALRDVSFSVRHGETLGLIGRNGAGKSTMLKLATGILEPSSGAVRIGGRTYAMLELGAGFHPELSGRDNIFLNGSIYGFGRKAMRRKFERIVEFAELERFIDTPVKYYSSGMFMRLGFATAINMDPQILVIDEVLAVGDVAFQRKCSDAIRDLQRQGVTILLVSHNSEAVREFCHRAVLLSGGRVVADGEVEGVLTEYARLQLQEQADAQRLASEPAPGGEHARARIASIVMRDGAMQPTHEAGPESPFTVDLTVLGGEDYPLDLALRWRTDLGLLLFESRCTLSPGPAGEPRLARCHIPSLPLHSEDIVLEAALCDPLADVVIDTTEAHLHIAAPKGPLLRFEHHWSQPATESQPLLRALPHR